jgi:tRNA-dihydrouridine synthase 3
MDAVTPAPPRDLFASRLALAPLTVGGNLPFRRLCVELGAEVTFGEMAVVKRLLDRRRGEFALLRSHPDELAFGVQLADRNPDSLVQGARLAQERGARFVDLNCGCPIDEITRRGLGSSLLRKPRKIGRLVQAMVREVSIPVTVKIRAGWSESEINASEVARICEEEGAAAVSVHGRTREQRYSRRADWDLVGRVAAERRITVIGNGDILTHFEARQRRARSGVGALMIGRGALIKPWIFREIREQREWLPTAQERLRVVWRYVELLREHFGEGDLARERIRRFLAWHLGFFCRYRPFPEADFAAASEEHPLLQTRQADDGELSPMERLLRHPAGDFHQTLARLLDQSRSFDEASDGLVTLSASLPETPEDLAELTSLREVAG